MRTQTLCLAAMVMLATRSAAQPLAGAASRGPLSRLPVPQILDSGGRFQAVIARVGTDIFVSGQPTERGLRELRAQGVTVVVNLRTPEEMRRSVPFDEPALAAQLGMKYVALPVRGTPQYPFSPATVERFAEAVRNADGKVLLHCTIGWRASHLWAAYLIKDRRVPVDSALANARAINLMDEHHMTMGSGASENFPVEDFLGIKLPSLKR